jgi:superoxide reductase
MSRTFYHCPHCQQVHTRLIDHGMPMTCCGEETHVLIKNNDAADSKMHRANIKKIGNFVTIEVGDDHPMMEIHHIQYLFLETNQGFQFKDVSQLPKAKADFILAKGEDILNVHVFCNIHLLWSLS